MSATPDTGRVIGHSGIPPPSGRTQMFVVSSYWMWTQGSTSVSVDIGLNPNRVYLMTGSLVGKDGGNYGQVYISTLCTGSGDEILCGVRDDPSDSAASDITRLGIPEFISGADLVTAKLRATDGLRRPERV